MATAEPFVRNQLYLVPLKDLQPDPDQPRKYLDPAALDELTASIAQHGILEPILFRRDAQTSLLYVVAGERRCAAARKAGLEQVPAVFIDTDNYAEIALVENLLRQDLTAIEEAEALERLTKGHSYTQEDLAKILGKSQATVSSTLSLNRLPQEIRDICRNDPSVPKRVLVDIAQAKQARSMITRFQAYQKKQAAQQAKEEETATRKRTAQETLVAVVESLTERLAKIDLNDWKEADRESLRSAIAGFNTAQEASFAAVKPTTSTVKKSKKKESVPQSQNADM